MIENIVSAKGLDTYAQIGGSRWDDIATATDLVVDAMRDTSDSGWAARVRELMHEIEV